MKTKKTIKKRIQRKRNTRKKFIFGGTEICNIEYYEEENKYIIKENDLIKYELYKNDKNFLGKGSFGTVFLCDKINNNNKCNKISLKQIVINPKKIQELEKEITILNLIKNNDELKKYGLEYFFVCKTLIHYYIFAELLHIDLKKFIQNPNLCNIKNIAYICDKLLRGLEVFHRNNLYHKDIKPENIMLTYNEKNEVNKVKYIDFGLSCISINNDCLSYTGTPYYMCPLLMNNKKYVYNPIKLQKIDKFALGMTFFYLFKKNVFVEYFGLKISTKIKLFQQYISIFNSENSLLQFLSKNKYDVEEETEIIEYIKNKDYYYLPVLSLINYTSNDYNDTYNINNFTQTNNLITSVKQTNIDNINTSVTQTNIDKDTKQKFNTNNYDDIQKNNILSVKENYNKNFLSIIEEKYIIKNKEINLKEYLIFVDNNKDYRKSIDKYFHVAIIFDQLLNKLILIHNSLNCLINIDMDNIILNVNCKFKDSTEEIIDILNVNYINKKYKNYNKKNYKNCEIENHVYDTEKNKISLGIIFYNLLYMTEIKEIYEKINSNIDYTYNIKDYFNKDIEDIEEFEEYIKFKIQNENSNFSEREQLFINTIINEKSKPESKYHDIYALKYLSIYQLLNGFDIMNDSKTYEELYEEINEENDILNQTLSF